MKNIIKIALKFGLTLPYYILGLFVLSLSKKPHHKFVRKLAGKIIEKSRKRITIKGYENIPKDGNVFFASNHRSMIDAVLINSLVDMPLSFAMKTSLNKGITKWLAKCTDSKFLYRTPKEDLSTIKEMCKEAKEGKNWMVYPEGTRNRDKNIKPFSAGIFKIPIAGQDTIIPVVIYNTESIIESGNKEDVIISFLSPVEYKDYCNKNTIQLSEYIGKIIETEYFKICKDQQV